MARYYLINRALGTNEWFLDVDEDTGENLVMTDIVTAIMAASIMTNTKERRIDDIIVAETVIANVETGETIGKFERSPQLDLLAANDRHAHQW